MPGVLWQRLEPAASAPDAATVRLHHDAHMVGDRSRSPEAVGRARLPEESAAAPVSPSGQPATHDRRLLWPGSPRKTKVAACSCVAVLCLTTVLPAPALRAGAAV